MFSQESSSEISVDGEHLFALVACCVHNLSVTDSRPPDLVLLASWCTVIALARSSNTQVPQNADSNRMQCDGLTASTGKGPSESPEDQETPDS